MADPQSYRPKTSEIPASPGVYRFRDPKGTVIYVGKAKNLRNRLTSYFQDPQRLHPRTYKMVHTASSVQWTVVNNEMEALTLEYSWIKEFSPRFNVMYNRNDMSFPYLAVTMNEQYPRALVMRGKRKKDVRYFGPFPQAWTIRETLDLLTRIFPVRTCAPGTFQRAKREGRPCLLGHIGKCSAPCAGWITPEDHRELAEELCRFMNGKTGPIKRELKAKMLNASENLEFERAAVYRDQLEAINLVLEKNTVVLPNGTDADVIGVAHDELELAVYVLAVRGGRIRGVRHWVSEIPSQTQDLSHLPGDAAADVLEQLYGNLPEIPDSEIRKQRQEQQTQAASVDDVEHLSAENVPPLILVGQTPKNATALKQWLTKRAGVNVTFSTPQRGDKKSLLEMAQKNAQEALQLHKNRRIADLSRRSQALEELRTYLDLPAIPLRIEGFDISHTQGTNQVASMVVFEDGAPNKNAYRQYLITPKDDGSPLDDTAAMSQVLTRRLKRLQAEQAGEQGYDEQGEALESGPIDPLTGKARRFSYRPDLIVVDGGLPQVNAAARTIHELGMDLPVVGLAKRLEEIWIPGEDFPLILPRTSAALYMLQHLRDESHRRAITHHRKKRNKAMTVSILDSIPGVGTTRQTALLQHFKTYKAIRNASVEELAEVPGISEKLAHTISEHLQAKDQK
ncbi:excinuclease ABC subunit C [Boudabousia liubingyangii]|uniref:excinuclease ABC subunit UvrC n=1 Tax=Boudabousia liubingyangii TaxID=1921764 RepID=UPI00093E7CD0|nr:excinuclease ABC subunit UvrC [Boudabousia liubingyangii]OKL47655.1 excinuclease ABC subunit C [Boudabousia liubingyangii]